MLFYFSGLASSMLEAQLIRVVVLRIVYSVSSLWKVFIVTIAYSTLTEEDCSIITAI